ncbi:hypothetical protein TELCIR_09921, partial [Teladorsagia circumcincta]
GVPVAPLFHAGFLVAIVTSSDITSMLSIYEAALWITHRTPCDIIPPRPVYTFYTITEVYFLMHMLGMQLVMTVERTMATIYVDTYESWSATSAIYFIIATFVIPGAMVLYFYKGAVFTEPNLHCFTDQSLVKDRISEGLITKPLTTRYQLSENIAGTSLTASLQTLQVAASVLYSVLTLVCSELHLGIAVNERDTNLLTKEGCYVICQLTMALTYDLLENTSARSLPLTQRICYELTVDVASNAIHQSFRLFDAVTCVVALIAQPVVHYKFLLPSALHFNLKIIQ